MRIELDLLMMQNVSAIDLSGNEIAPISEIEFFVDGQIIVNQEIPIRKLIFSYHPSFKQVSQSSKHGQ